MTMANKSQNTLGTNEDTDLIAPDQSISAGSFAMWLVSGTAEQVGGGFTGNDQDSDDAGDGNAPQKSEGDSNPPKKSAKGEKHKKKDNPLDEEHVPSVDEYPDLVEIGDITDIISTDAPSSQQPNLVGFDFSINGDSGPLKALTAKYDWATDYYGKDEVDDEDEQDGFLDDGYSNMAGRDLLDDFFDDRSTRMRPSAQSKVKGAIRTPLASDFGEDDDDDFEYEQEKPSYVSLFDIDTNEKPFSVRSLGRSVSHRMTTTLQRFLDGNVNLGPQVSALWRGFPEAYGISVGRQRYSGFAMRPTRAVLTGSDFREVRHMSVAKVMSFDAFVQALADGDPYAIEFFGITPENLLYADASAQAVLSSVDAFMSKRCGHAALATVVDLIRLIGRPADYDVAFGRDRRERAIRAIDIAKEDFTEAYGRFARIYVDVQNYEGRPTVMASLNLRDMPISEMSDFSTTLADIARGYGMMAEARGRSGLRGEELAYTMAEVIRILQTTSELLDGEGLHVFRDRKVHVLNGIMRGRLIGPDQRPTREFWEIVDEEQLRLEDSIERTELPDEPDQRMVERLLASQNRRTILQDA